MIQDPAAASRASPTDTKLDEKGLVLKPELDGFYRCRKCNKPHLCPEPYMFHEQGCNHTDLSSAVPTLPEGSSADQSRASSDTIGNIHIASKHEIIPKPRVKACLSVWCWDCTHYVQVNVSQSLEPGFPIRQVEEDKIFTVKEFLQMEFSRTEGYEDAVKKITELNRRCCRPVQDTITARASEHQYENTRTDPIQSSYSLVVNWLQSYFSGCILRQRRSSRSNLPPNSSCPSTEAIIADPGHRLELNAVAYCEEKNSKGDTKHRTPTTNTPALVHTASAQMPIQAPRSYHSGTHEPCLHPEVTDGFDDAAGVIAVSSFQSTCKGVLGCGVLVITKSDNISLLQRVDFDALIGRKRIVRQLLDILGESTYNQLLEFERKRACIQDSIYSGILPDEAMEIKVDKGLPLEQCSPVLQAHVHSILNI